MEKRVWWMGPAQAYELHQSFWLRVAKVEAEGLFSRGLWNMCFLKHDIKWVDACTSPTPFIWSPAPFLHCESSRALMVVFERAASVSRQIACRVGWITGAPKYPHYNSHCLQRITAMEWMFVPPSNSYVKALIPKVMTFGGEPFQR